MKLKKKDLPSKRRALFRVEGSLRPEERKSRLMMEKRD
jgi:hypothetical protein